MDFEFSENPKNQRPLTQLPVLVDALENKLNLVKVCLSYSWGGLEQVAASDAIDAGSLGLKVRLLCLEGTPIHEHLAKRPEVEVLPLGFRPRNYFDFKMRNEIGKLASEGTNLFHTHQTSILGSVSPWLWNRPEIALLASRHIMSNHNKKNFFHRAIYGRLDALLVMSNTLRRNVLDTHPIVDRRVKVVNLGLDFEKFDPAKVDGVAQRARWGADSDTIVIGLVGRIDPAKGQATFIKSAAGMLMNMKPDEKLKFVIVGEETLGSTGAHLAELQEMVRQFRLGDIVTFTGFQENIPEVMSAFDIFVMPSRQEAFGLVAIEAMAMECPIVISQGGSAEEIVGQNNEFGLTMRPNDAFDLQRQLRWMLDHPEERMKMGKLAREHVRKHYDRQNRLRRTLEIYERVLRRRRAI